MTVQLMRRELPDDDQGFTLVEAIMAMTVMSIFLMIFTGSIISMFGSSNHSQGVANTAADVNQAFISLDSRIRYASYVSVPGQDANDLNNWYVEFQDANAVPATCYQLRVDTLSGQLQQRSWTGTTLPGAWRPLASHITNGAATGDDAPFRRTLATSTVPSTQLTVDLVATAGSGTKAVDSSSVTTFTALNTTRALPSTQPCLGRRP